MLGIQPFNQTQKVGFTARANSSKAVTKKTVGTLENLEQTLGVENRFVEWLKKARAATDKYLADQANKSKKA